MASPTEESPTKLAPSSKKKPKEKSNSNSLKGGGMSNSLFSGGGNISRMDASELPSFSNERSSSSSSSDGKLSNFVPGLKNHSATDMVNSGHVSSKGSKKKSASESSIGGGSSGGQSSMTNSTHSTDGGSRHTMSQSLANRTGRSFSSGSSDGEDDREKEPQKPRLSRKTKSLKPVKPGPLESDDEATDSADEGNSGEEERGRRRRGENLTGVLGLRHSDRLVSRKDSSESTNSANSPVLNPSLTTSKIFVESALPKEPAIGPGSPVNMAVGYGAAADSMAPPSVFDKTPTQSPLGTPTMDSPKPMSDGQQSPGTPIPISPPSTEATEVCSCNTNIVAAICGCVCICGV